MQLGIGSCSLYINTTFFQILFQQIEKSEEVYVPTNDDIISK